MDDPGSSSPEAGFTPTTLDVAVDGPVGKVVLSRPALRNAMSYEMLEELIAAARWMDDRPDVKVVVFSGEGPAFCGGFDLAQVSDGSAPGRGADVGYRMSSAIAGMRAMTIAAVHSHCVGGGVVLAAACDLRVAASSALFRIPEVDLGMPLFWNGIPLLGARDRARPDQGAGLDWPLLRRRRGQSDRLRQSGRTRPGAPRGRRCTRRRAPRPSPAWS